MIMWDERKTFSIHRDFIRWDVLYYWDGGSVKSEFSELWDSDIVGMYMIIWWYR